MDDDLRQRLLALQHADEETRARLLENRSLFDGYAAEMEQVHTRNARQLMAIVDEAGWPGVSLAGEDGAAAAWLVAQHAIGLPDVQRRCLDLIREAVAEGEAPVWQEAYLTDRIRFNERRPQLFGTLLDWDEHGALNPWPIEEPESVSERREAAGLPRLEDAVEFARAQAAADGAAAPEDYAARQHEIEEWARRAGWL